MDRRGWLPVAVCVGVGLNGARLRGRVGAIEIVDVDEVGPADGVGRVGAADGTGRVDLVGGTDGGGTDGGGPDGGGPDGGGPDGGGAAGVSPAGPARTSPADTRDERADELRDDPRHQHVFRTADGVRLGVTRQVRADGDEAGRPGTDHGSGPVSTGADQEFEGDRPEDGYVLLRAPGVGLGPRERRAAAAHARRHGYEVLDLIPAELPAHRVLDLARMVDPATYRTARLARGRGAFLAILVDREVLDRAGLKPGEHPEADLVTALGTLKRHAAATTGLAVLPGLTGPEPDDGGSRLAVQRAAYAWEPANRVLPLLRDGAILLGATANPAGAAAAAALSWLQPLLVGAGRVRVRPGTLRGSALTRRRVLPAHLTDAPRLATASLGLRDAGAPAAPRTTGLLAGRSAAEIAEKRLDYQRELADGLDRFFEEPRTDCPWCGGRDLSLRMTGRDVAQGKPGRFRYDRCTGCGHVFQNPRLSLDGLDFYYRDFYDGLGGAMIEEVFGFSADPYLDRARLTIPTPDRWLDVGGGQGHFCNVARTVWPETGFDALDIGAGIEEAERRRWVDRAYRGFFPDIAAMLTGQYDVISMFHYLEHTRDPQAELDAAAVALSPGSHLLIEVPNPDSPAARLYGPLWPGWLIPQHQHLIPAANLAAALRERGFDIQEVRFGPVHQKGDPVMALYGLLQTLAPSPSAVWRPQASPGRARAVRALTAAGLAPAFAAALVADAASRPYLTRADRSNAYRILARRV